ncbi:MAG: VOC family protein [Cyanobacteria bacterium P01_F01_bin.150]
MSMHPIGHVAICVEELDQAVQFYRQLGLELSYQTKDMAYFYSGAQGVALMRVGSSEAKPHFGFSCTSLEEVEQVHRDLTRRGITVTPIQRVGEVAAFYGQDPSGNWFEYLFEPDVQPTMSIPPQRRTRAHSARSKGFG